MSDFDQVIADLHADFPGAHFELLAPVTSDRDAEQRLETISQACSALVEERTPVADTAYTEFVNRLAHALDMDPALLLANMDKIVATGLIAGAVASLLFQSTVHGLHALDAAALVVHGADAVVTVGVSVGASLLAAFIIKHTNDPQRAHVAQLVELISLTVGLAEELSLPGRLTETAATLNLLALQEVQP